MKKLVIARRFSQVFFLAAVIYVLWAVASPLRGVLRPDILFKADPLIMLFISISERVMLPGMAVAVFMSALTLLLGRFLCGWVCPLGTAIDICGAVIPDRRKRKLGSRKNKAWRSVKFYMLGFIALASFLGIQAAWIFDPLVITARFVSLNLIPSITFFLDSAFVLVIKQLNFYAPVYDLYRGLKASVLGADVRYFAHSAVVLASFAAICASTFAGRRLWCRALCPLGALYSLIAGFSPMRRVVEKCVNCLRCGDGCRMRAINEDMTYVKGECILCMDCIYGCPTKKAGFGWRPAAKEKRKGFKKGITRREFILLLCSSFLSLGFRNRRQMTRAAASRAGNIIRPPGALKEEDFLGRCIRCGNCMQACITNGLQPVLFEAGPEGIWTPQLVPETGYCEYNCTLCGQVCPTGAIPGLSLQEKRKVRLGLAEIDTSVCIACSENKECIVCEEHCPLPEKAVKVINRQMSSKTVPRPYVDPGLCIGCGICQTKCPTRPLRAIRVSPSPRDRG